MSKILSFILAASLFMSLLVSCHPSIKATTMQIKDDEVQELKKRTLIVILPEFQSNYIDQYNELLGEAWTLSPIKAVNYADFAKYSDVNKYSYLELINQESVYVAAAGMPTRGGYTPPEYDLKLTIRKSVTDKKGVEKIKGYPVVEMALDMAFDATKPGYKSKDAGVQMYTAGIITNYSPSHLLAYLRYFQQKIGTGKFPSEYTEYSDKEMKASLANDTLFIPKQLLDSLAFRRGGDWLRAEDFKAYAGPYRIVTTAEFIDVIKNRKGKPVFLFDHVISGNDKFVTVWEINSGTPVHRRYTQVSRALKSKDIEGILK